MVHLKHHIFFFYMVTGSDSIQKLLRCYTLIAYMLLFSYPIALMCYSHLKVAIHCFGQTIPKYIIQVMDLAKLTKFIPIIKSTRQEYLQQPTATQDFYQVLKMKISDLSVLI